MARLFQSVDARCELSIRGILRDFGLTVGQVTRKMFEARIRELVAGHPTLERIAEAMAFGACNFAGEVRETA